MLYRTKEGDVLDWICWKQYGYAPGIVETVLIANPGLAAHGSHLPGGLLINLPKVTVVPPNEEPIRLWDG